LCCGTTVKRPCSGEGVLCVLKLVCVCMSQCARLFKCPVSAGVGNVSRVCVWVTT